jgi:hypothetical protein
MCECGKWIQVYHEGSGKGGWAGSGAGWSERSVCGEEEVTLGVDASLVCVGHDASGVAGVSAIRML